MSCQGCNERHLMCHQHCEDYKKTAERAKLIREERSKSSKFNGVTAKTDKSHDAVFIKSVRESVK